MFKLGQVRNIYRLLHPEVNYSSISTNLFPILNTLPKKCNLDLDNTSKPSKPKHHRPITAQYTEPRMTLRMRQVTESKIPKSAREDSCTGCSHFHLCAKCGFVMCSEAEARKQKQRMRQSINQFIKKNFNPRASEINKIYSIKQSVLYK